MKQKVIFVLVTVISIIAWLGVMSGSLCIIAYGGYQLINVMVNESTASAPIDAVYAGELWYFLRTVFWALVLASGSFCLIKFYKIRQLIIYTYPWSPPEITTSKTLQWIAWTIAIEIALFAITCVLLIILKEIPLHDAILPSLSSSTGLVASGLFLAFYVEWFVPWFFPIFDRSMKLFFKDLRRLFRI